MAESVELKPWVLVPREPTLKMQHAYFDVIDANLRRVENDAGFGRYDNHRLAYAAMISAAPAPEKAGDVEGLVGRLRAYRSRSEWGDEIEHTICNEAADALLSLSCHDTRLLNMCAEAGAARREAEARAEAAERLLEEVVGALAEALPLARDPGRPVPSHGSGP